jgi:hypothetical protein
MHQNNIFKNWCLKTSPGVVPGGAKVVVETLIAVVVVIVVEDNNGVGSNLSK